MLTLSVAMPDSCTQIHNEVLSCSSPGIRWQRRCLCSNGTRVPCDPPFSKGVLPHQFEIVSPPISGAEVNFCQPCPYQTPMAVVPEAVEALNQVSVVVASSGSDFGGLAGPIAGLGFLTGLIFLLSTSPDEEE